MQRRDVNIFLDDLGITDLWGDIHVAAKKADNLRRADRPIYLNEERTDSRVVRKVREILHQVRHCTNTVALLECLRGGLPKYTHACSAGNVTDIELNQCTTLTHLNRNTHGFGTH